MTASPDPGPNLPTPSRGEKAQRVADADRDRTVTLLREHVVAGRLTLDEFSDRVGIALQARTRGELDVALADLPALKASLPEPVGRPARRRFVAVMSGSAAKGRWRLAARTSAVAVMGGCEMDLRQAEIDGPEVVITAVAFWGGIKITVPEGIDVEMEGLSIMGGRSLRLRDVPIVPGSPRIRIRAYSIMGGIEIRSRPNRARGKPTRSVVDVVLDSISNVPGDASGPIDLASLSRDIRDQLRAERRSGRSRARPEPPPVPPRPDSPPDTPPVAPPVAHSQPWPQAEPSPEGEPWPEPESSTTPASDGTVTILFSDMVNYAGMTEELGDAVSRDLLREHHRIVRAAFERHGGREVKVQGDGFMVAFGGVARALRCAIAMQQAFAARTETQPERPIAIHIGVHTGEAIEEDDDFLGHTVIVASRLADAAGPGEILVSSLSEQLVSPSGEFSFSDPRDAALKGMTRTQRVASLLWAGS